MTLLPRLRLGPLPNQVGQRPGDGERQPQELQAELPLGIDGMVGGETTPHSSGYRFTTETGTGILHVRTLLAARGGFVEFSVVIQPLDGQGFRATSGDPFPAAADEPTRDEALHNLRAILEAKFQAGAEVVRLRVGPSSGAVWPNDAFTRDWLEGIAAARAKANTRPDPWDNDPATQP